MLLIELIIFFVMLRARNRSMIHCAHAQPAESIELSLFTQNVAISIYNTFYRCLLKTSQSQYTIHSN